jgi:hypothetical protein
LGFVQDDALILAFLRAFLAPRTALVAENLALRQQLAVLQVPGKRPKLRKRERLFWVWLSQVWSGWRSCLMIVKPETFSDRFAARQADLVASQPE